MSTEERKVQLGATVDTSEAKKGFQEIGRDAESMADKVRKAGAKAKEGVSAVGDGAAPAADKVSAQGQRVLRSLEQQANRLSMTTAEYAKFRAAQAGVADAAGPLVARIEAATAPVTKLGASAAQTAAAMRQVPAQFTDIITSLQGGQAPMTVMLQQGGQLKDMFGGIGPAAKALGGYVLGLVNPLTVTAAAAGALALAYYRGSLEADNFNKALVMSGNVAGVTSAQMQIMARNIDAVVGTQAQAADVLAQIAATGRVAGENMQALAETAIRLERDAGIPVENTVKQFEELGRSPVEATLKLNETYRYLTLEVYNQIKALQEHGRESEAAALAQKTYADAMSDRTRQLEQNLGIIQRAWRAVGDVAREAWDQILGIGRPAGPGESAMPTKGYATLAAMFPTLMGPGAAAAAVGGAARRGLGMLFTSDAEREADSETRRLASRSQTASAEAAREKAEGDSARIAAQRRIDDMRKQVRSRADIRKDEIEQLDRDRKRLGLSQAEYDKLLAGINEKYKDPKKSGGAGIGGATRRLDLSGIQNDMREELAMVDAQSRALELRRQGGLVSEAEYYEKRRALVQQGIDIEKKGLTEQLDRLEQEKAKGKEALEVQKQIGDVKSKLRLAEINGQNKLNEVNQQAAAAEKRRAATLAQLTLTHERYVESLERRARREVEAIGLSDRERSYRTGRDSIEDRYLSERRKLEDQKMFSSNWSPDDEKVFQRRLDLLADEQKKELALWDQTFAGIAEAQAKWELGAAAGLKNYADSAADVAGQMKSAMQGAFKGAEDALVDLVVKGKGDFKSLVESILADLARMSIRQNITGPLAGALGGALSGGGTGGGSGLGGLLAGALGGVGGFFSGALGWLFGGGRASGGSVAPGRFYEVNERAPELLSVGGRTMLMMGNQGGTVSPVAQGAGGQHNYYFTVGDVATVGMLRQALGQSQRQAAGALARSQSYGGRFGA